jgi:hypothetical protein
MSVMYLANYCGLGIPVVVIGFMSLSLGLVQTTGVAAAVIGVLCLLMLGLMAAQRRSAGR